MTKSRVLRKLWGGTAATWSGDTASPVLLVGNSSSWKTVNLTVGAVDMALVYRVDYFDLSGYTISDETLYPQGVRINDTEFFSGTGPSTGVIIKRLDLLCTKAPREEDLTNISQFEGWMTPGSSSSRYSLEEIVSARMSRYIQTADVGGFQQTAQTSWGTCAATAGEKLYIVQAYLFQNAVQVLIPGSSLVVPALIDTEPDLEYIMRLARGYEVQGAV